MFEHVRRIRPLANFDRRPRYMFGAACLVDLDKREMLRTGPGRIFEILTAMHHSIHSMKPLTDYEVEYQELRYSSIRETVIKNKGIRSSESCSFEKIKSNWGNNRKALHTLSSNKPSRNRSQYYSLIDIHAPPFGGDGDQELRTPSNLQVQHFKLCFYQLANSSNLCNLHKMPILDLHLAVVGTNDSQRHRTDAVLE
jgi:hypothetical protein